MQRVKDPPPLYPNYWLDVFERTKTIRARHGAPCVEACHYQACVAVRDEYLVNRALGLGPTSLTMKTAEFNTCIISQGSIY